jgi:hypothetical protein
VLLSNIRPARTAIARGAGGHATTPPSEPSQGTLPAPRQGVESGFTCAHSAAELNKIPHATIHKRLLRIDSPPISSTSTSNCVVELVWAHLYTGLRVDRTELFDDFCCIGFSLWGLGFAETERPEVRKHCNDKIPQAKASATGFRKSMK